MGFGQVTRAAERMEDELLPHVPMLISRVKALIGDAPVKVVESKQAKFSRGGDKDMDLQQETKRNEQLARGRFQQKCLAALMRLADLTEISECAEMKAFVAEIESSPFAGLWAAGRIQEGVPEPEPSA